MKIFAHRGYSARFPESTRAAYEGAVFARADGFECDVRLTRDGEIVCFHDRTLKRNAGINKAVSRSTMKELRSLVNAISLDELLDIAIREKKDLLIETKHPVVSGGAIEKAVVDLIHHYREAIERSGIEVVIISFSYLALRRVKARGIKTAKVVRYGLGALISRSKDIALNIKTLRRYPFLFRVIRAERIYVWTVNSKDDLKWLKNREIYGVITDRPKRARRIISGEKIWA
ncbi:MAG: glycerophosphodiester phosphodiesterase [Actinobacteria bacterium]|nr:glycerophosphodiester phosphodiesterase [Actinomycetota bacterium]